MYYGKKLFIPKNEKFKDYIYIFTLVMLFLNVNEK